jgi:hypothetical protein
VVYGNRRVMFQVSPVRRFSIMTATDTWSIPQ